MGTGLGSRDDQSGHGALERVKGKSLKAAGTLRWCLPLSGSKD